MEAVLSGCWLEQSREMQQRAISITDHDTHHTPSRPIVRSTRSNQPASLSQQPAMLLELHVFEAGLRRKARWIRSLCQADYEDMDPIHVAHRSLKKEHYMHEEQEAAASAAEAGSNDKVSGWDWAGLGWAGVGRQNFGRRSKQPCP